VLKAPVQDTIEILDAEKDKLHQRYAVVREREARVQAQRDEDLRRQELAAER